jgi:hypothetical protein
MFRGYAVGWVTLVFINAGIAQGKNRSGLNWGLLSLILGPLATFALVVLFEKVRRGRYVDMTDSVHIC